MKRFQFFYQRFFEHGVKAKDAASAMDKVKQRQMEFLEKTHHNPQFLMVFVDSRDNDVDVGVDNDDDLVDQLSCS
jgi:hypothetical protein